MQGRIKSDLDDELDAEMAEKSPYVSRDNKLITPTILVLVSAMLIIVCFMIFNKGAPAARPMGNGFISGQTVAFKTINQTYTCPQCGWQGKRMAIDELGNCVCPQCGFCPYKKNIQTAQGVQAITSASPNIQIVTPLGIEVKDMTGGVLTCSVYGNSWADKAKMQDGDMILKFNRSNVGTVSQLMDCISKAPSERRVPVTVLRNGKKVKLNVLIGEGDMHGVTIPNSAFPVGWQPGQGGGQGQRVSVVCAGCGFQMQCAAGSACPICPRCNNAMLPSNGINQANVAGFTRGTGQNAWCPPGATTAAFQPGQGQGMFARCPGCGFRMLCQQGGVCPQCPRCSGSMVLDNGNGGGFQRGTGQNPWCPPGGGRR